METNNSMPPEENDEDEDDDKYEDNYQRLKRYSFNVNKSNSKPSKDPLLGLRTFLLTLPSVLWATIIYMIGAAIIIIWNKFHPVQYSGDRTTLLSIFLGSFFFGLGFIIYVIKGDSLPGGGRSSNPWVMVIAALGFSLLFLYMFIVAK